MPVVVVSGDVVGVEVTEVVVGAFDDDVEATSCRRCLSNRFTWDTSCNITFWCRVLVVILIFICTDIMANRKNFCIHPLWTLRRPMVLSVHF